MKRKLFLLLITLSISFYTFGKIEDGGFDLKTRINKETKTLYDKNGYDINGYDINGYDKNNFNRLGINKKTGKYYDGNNLDVAGYDICGNKNGFYDFYNQENNLSGNIVSAKYDIFDDSFPDDSDYRLDQINNAIIKLSNENISDLEKIYLKIALENKKVLLKKRESSFKEIITNYDEFKRIYWYYTKYDYQRDFENYPGIYIGKSNTKKWLIFKFSYHSSDWLFVKKLILKNDSDMMTLYPLYDVKRSVLYDGKIMEVFECDITKDTNRIKKILNSRNLKIRLEGTDYYDDFDFSNNEDIKKDISSILNKYIELK